MRDAGGWENSGTSYVHGETLGIALVNIRYFMSNKSWRRCKQAEEKARPTAVGDVLAGELTSKCRIYAGRPITSQGSKQHQKHQIDLEAMNPSQHPTFVGDDKSKRRASPRSPN